MSLFVDPGYLVLWAASAFGAGVLNAIAGGGSFLTFPALVFSGLPPIIANATSAVAVAPGYWSGAWGFKTELKQVGLRRLVPQVLATAIGGLCGATLLVVTPTQVFRGLIPWLLVFATLLFALAPQLVQIQRPNSQVTSKALDSSMTQIVCLFGVSVYGGYFNGGLGILLMALYALSGEKSVHTANALKNLHSGVLATFSLLVFSWTGSIAWATAGLMMAFAAIGGLTGAHLARSLPARWVRRIVVTAGCCMSLAFFLRP